jgi:F-type H+-transporting ATPase subunit delta
MSKTMSANQPAVHAYATSILQLAKESGQVDPIAGELREIHQILSENPAFQSLLADPGVSEAEREQVLKRVFAGKINQILMNALGVMNNKGRLGILSEVAQNYQDLLDEERGKIEVDVTVAQKLSNEELEQVRRRVGEALKKDVIIHQYVDDSIIGGLIVRVQDKLIDASVRTQLQMIKQQMLSSRK